MREYHNKGQVKYAREGQWPLLWAKGQRVKEGLGIKKVTWSDCEEGGVSEINQEAIGVLWVKTSRILQQFRKEISKTEGYLV